jgi:hypothetical protein
MELYLLSFSVVAVREITPELAVNLPVTPHGEVSVVTAEPRLAQRPDPEPAGPRAPREG